jgi:hypothetical protein
VWTDRHKYGEWHFYGVSGLQTAQVGMFNSTEDNSEQGKQPHVYIVRMRGFFLQREYFELGAEADLVFHESGQLPFGGTNRNSA